jgi:hypothetical protein
MQKNPTQPGYDPKLPNEEYLKREHGKHDSPHQPTANPGTTSPTPQEIKREPHKNPKGLSEKDALSGEAALSTNGEEMRPKDGSLDGGTAR